MAAEAVYREITVRLLVNDEDGDSATQALNNALDELDDQISVFDSALSERQVSAAEVAHLPALQTTPGTGKEDE